MVKNINRFDKNMEPQRAAGLYALAAFLCVLILLLIPCTVLAAEKSVSVSGKVASVSGKVAGSGFEDRHNRDNNTSKTKDQVIKARTLDEYINLTEADLDQTALAESIRRFSDPEWVYGTDKPLTEHREGHFEWGLLRLDFTRDHEVIRDAALRSDGLAADYLARVPDLLRGCPLEAEALGRALLSPPDCDREAAEDILNLLLNGE